MNEPDWKGALAEAFEHALAYLEGLPARRIAAPATLAGLRAALGGPLPERPLEAREVIEDLVLTADPGVVASGSGRFFGFVIGGATPAALAADWLASTWDQNAGLYVIGPSASVVEEVAGEWLAELLGLPIGVSVGFVTGAQMANFTALAAALHDVLRRVGWDLAADGLWGAPRVRILAGQARHGTIDRALRFLGVGKTAIVEVESDDQGRMKPEALAALLKESEGPAIVCTQVGNVNSGAIDPVAGDLRDCTPAWRVGARGRRLRAVGGGKPAAASSAHRSGAGRFMGDRCAQVAQRSVRLRLGILCSPRCPSCGHGNTRGLPHAQRRRRARPLDYNPEHSRRARGFAVYAALRALGREGVTELVERCCALAGRFADQLAAADDIEVTQSGRTQSSPGALPGRRWRR